MHARIYFVVVIFSIVIACFKDDQLESLTHENDVLKKSLRAYVRPATLNPQDLLFDPFYKYRQSAALSPAGAVIPSYEPNGDKFADAGASQGAALEIRKQLTRSRREAEAYLMMIDALKGEINIKDAELHSLREDIVRYQSGIALLLDSLTRKEQALEEVLAKSDLPEGSDLQDKVQELSKNLRIAEAEACYATALRAEAAAHKIMFAPARKRESLLEALEVYKKAFSLGKQEASENISRLQRSLTSPVASN